MSGNTEEENPATSEAGVVSTETTTNSTEQKDVSMVDTAKKDHVEEEKTEKKIIDIEEKPTTKISTTATTTTTDSKLGDERDRTWDHTDRKVVVHNVLKFMRQKEIDQLAQSWLQKLDDPKSVKYANVKKPPTSTWIRVTLEKAEMVEPFLAIFSKNKIKNRRGQILYATRADAKSDIIEKKNNRKRKGDDRDDNSSSQPESKKIRAPKTADEVRDTTTPLWRESYEKQLETKWKEMVKRCAMRIVQEVKGKFRTLEKEARRNPKNRKVVPMYKWLLGKKAIDVQKVIPSPHILEYRNKSEFTFGYHFEMPSPEEGAEMSAEEQLEKMIKTPAVGFLAAGWSGGISHPHVCQNVPGEACTVADIVNEFLKTSPIPPYNAKDHRGLWRTLTIRTSKRTGECMIVIVHASPSGGLGAKDDGTDDYSGVFESEKDRLVELLKNKELGKSKRDYPEPPKADAKEGDDGNTASEAATNESPIAPKDQPIRVTSIFFQEYSGVSIPPPEHPVQHMFGSKTIHEKLGKCSFQISPGAFFQVNTECAETLYNVAVEQVKEVSEKPEETLLFDVCCGTGTIGLTCMKEGVVGRVVGVDISEPAIDDAKANAELNGYAAKEDDPDPLTKFIASRAELVLGNELKKFKDSSMSVVAVVDPAREGLHPDVIKAIRGNEKIQRLVYVSCNPSKTLVVDAGLLCQPPTKNYKGIPFKPVSAQPVDMFPLTTHCEMVMAFDRLDNIDGEE